MTKRVLQKSRHSNYSKFLFSELSKMARGYFAEVTIGRAVPWSRDTAGLALLSDSQADREGT